MAILLLLCRLCTELPNEVAGFRSPEFPTPKQTKIPGQVVKLYRVTANIKIEIIYQFLDVLSYACIETQPLELILELHVSIFTSEIVFQLKTCCHSRYFRLADISKHSCQSREEPWLQRERGGDHFTYCHFRAHQLTRFSFAASSKVC